LPKPSFGGDGNAGVFFTFGEHLKQQLGAAPVRASGSPRDPMGQARYSLTWPTKALGAAFLDRYEASLAGI
jgi:hypothetical protein